MITFILSVAALVLGYIVYGTITEKVFGIKADRKTPAYAINDGVDFVPMDWKKVLLIQFLNIAGTGPIFGAIAGAMFGPAAFMWIVFGCIFAGAVHDFTVGMLSLRNDGASIAELVGKYLGKTPRYIMRVFSVVLLIFVGAVFVTTPAQVINTLVRMRNPEANVYNICLVVIILYYVLATILPIDKLIGKIYPIFGAALIIMGVGIIVTMFATGKMAYVPEFAFQNLNPGRAGGTIMSHVFPFLFISIACGAISGFHATQSPLMARCLEDEKQGKWVFYGAMILEGVIALIWAAVAMGYWNGVGGLADAMKKLGGAAGIVTASSTELMGWIGGVLAVLGVVACPITSGDTAFRSARLTIADSIKYDQKPLKNRFVIAIPLFAVGIALVLYAIKDAKNFNILWRYFAWTNQTLATIALWAVSAYLAKTGKFYWLTLIPATFMTVVVTAYFFTAGECLGPILTRAFGGGIDLKTVADVAAATAANAAANATTYTVGIVVGLVLAAVLFALFVPLIGIKQKNTISE